MASNAPQTLYRQEFIAGFEVNQSLLRDACTTQGTVKGNSIIFLVADSGGATAVTRGIDGLIPARADDLTQVTCTLTEFHDLVRKTRFNIFESQSDQRAIMIKTSMGTINRKIDSQILTALSSATVAANSSGETASVGLVMKAVTILQNSDVPWDNNIWGIVSPCFMAYMLQSREFSGGEYVDRRPIQNNDPAWADRPKPYNWMGINFIAHPSVSGVGTSSETCYFLHQSAIGHGFDTAGLNTMVDYNGEQDYSYARASGFMGAKLLQNSGVVKVLHDGSAYVAA